MEVRQRDIWLANLGEPIGSEAGYVRPVLVAQIDAINVSRLTTYIVLPITGLISRAAVPWNYALPVATDGLDKESVVQTNLILTINQSQLIERLGSVSVKQLQQVLARLDIALGRR